MRFLIIDTCLVQDLAKQLALEGNDVLYYYPQGDAHPSAEKELYGLNCWEEWGVTKIETPLKYYDAVDVIIFPDNNAGADVDELRKKGYAVFGPGKYAERLENERTYPMRVFPQLIYPLTYKVKANAINNAINTILQDDKIFTIKIDKIGDSSVKSYVPINPDDTINYLQSLADKIPEDTEITLQERIEGCEIALTAFFNGKKFLRPLLINFEEKRLFPGGMGPFTGEMGSSMFYDMNNKLFRETMGKPEIEQWLMGIGFRGIIDVNCIINEIDGRPYILEFTPRFGVPIMMIMLASLKNGIGEIIYNCAKGIDKDFEADNMWTVGIGHNCCGYPFEGAMKERGFMKPIYGIDGAIGKGVDVHFAGVYKDDSGVYRVCPDNGRALVINGKAPGLKSALYKAIDGAKQIQIPNGYWRPDIGLRLCEEREILWGKGYLDKSRYNSIIE